MRTTNFHGVLGVAALAGMTMLGSTASAITINVDGSNYTTLSAAVAAAYAADDGADIINLMVDSLPTADGQIVLNKPIVINGDGNNNSVKCDLLADVLGIQAAADLGDVNKAYIEVLAPGSVVLNDLKIHPNENGVPDAANTALNVDGIRLAKPALAEEVGEYTLNRVWVSGSDASNNYIPLDTGNDIYTGAAKKWSGGGVSQAVIQVSQGAGLGIYNATLNNCHVGLGQSSAMNIPASGGSTTVNSGLYGHCGGDGIRLSGTSVTLAGTASNRLRVVRSTNISGGNRHAIEIDSGGKLLLIEYVDIASINTANLFKMNDSGGGQEVTTEMRYVRGLGKFDAGANSSLFANGHSRIDNAHDVTFVGSGANFNPVQTQANSTEAINFTNSIFTSENSGVLQLDKTALGAGGITLTNCALPTDGVTSETLADPPTTGTAITNGFVTIVSPVSSSPQYLLTLEDYDWSDNQGASDPLNGPGNANVLRPSNVAYLTAGTGSTPLVGGAGPLLSGIDPGTWMLME